MPVGWAIITSSLLSGCGRQNPDSVASGSPMRPSASSRQGRLAELGERLPVVAERYFLAELEALDRRVTADPGALPAAEQEGERFEVRVQRRALVAGDRPVVIVHGGQGRPSSAPGAAGVVQHVDPGPLEFLDAARLPVVAVVAVVGLVPGWLV